MLAFVAAWAFLWLGSSGATLQAWCAGFSVQWLLLLQRTGSRHSGFSSCGFQALEHRLDSCGTQAYLLCHRWDLPRSGVEPMFRAPLSFSNWEQNSSGVCGASPQILGILLPDAELVLLRSEGQKKQSHLSPFFQNSNHFCGIWCLSWHVWLWGVWIWWSGCHIPVGWLSIWAGVRLSISKGWDVKRQSKGVSGHWGHWATISASPPILWDTLRKSQQGRFLLGSFLVWSFGSTCPECLYQEL